MYRRYVDEPVLHTSASTMANMLLATTMSTHLPSHDTVANRNIVRHTCYSTGVVVDGRTTVQTAPSPDTATAVTAASASQAAKPVSSAAAGARAKFGGSGAQAGGTSGCGKCGKAVYMMEKMLVGFCDTTSSASCRLPCVAGIHYHACVPALIYRRCGCCCCGCCNCFCRRRHCCSCSLLPAAFCTY